MSLTKSTDLPPIPGGAASEQVNYSPQISGGQSFPVETNDLLRVDIYSLVAGLTFRVSGVIRTWNHRGEVMYIPISYQLSDSGTAVTSNGVINRFERPLSRGDLISLMIQPNAGTLVQYGDVFVRVAIVRGGPNDGSRFPTFTLFQDYLTSLGYLAFPGSEITTGPEKAGALRTVDLTTGAGQDVAFIVPDNQLWKVYGLYVNFTASAGIGNRVPKIYIVDSVGNNVREYRTDSVITPGQSVQYLIESCAHATSIDAAAAAPIKHGGLATVEVDVEANLVARIDFQPILIRSGFTIRTLTTGLDLADVWSFMALIERWIVPNTNTP